MTSASKRQMNNEIKQPTPIKNTLLTILIHNLQTKEYSFIHSLNSKMSEDGTTPPIQNNDENGASQSHVVHESDLHLPSPPPDIVRSNPDDNKDHHVVIVNDAESDIQARKAQLIQQMEEEDKFKEERRRELLHRLQNGIDSDSEDEEGTGRRRPTTAKKDANMERIRLSLDSVTVSAGAEFDRNFNVESQSMELDGPHSHDGHQSLDGDDDLISETSADYGNNVDVDFYDNGHQDEGECDDMVSIRQKENNDFQEDTGDECEPIGVKDGADVRPKVDVDMVDLDATDDIDDKDITDTEGEESIQSQASIGTDKMSGETDFYRFLKTGFDHVRKEMKPKSPKKKKNDEAAIEGVPSPFHNSVNRMPLVNFIDPTSANAATRPTTKPEDDSPSRHMKRRAWTREKKKLKDLCIFEKFDTVFHQHHNAILRKVSYRNLRTNEIDVIEDLPLRTKLTAPTMSDPAEWHNSPICHVYIAACCSVEHYRTKVRPSLRAFVNQIDGAGSGNQAEAISAAKEAARKEFGAKKRNENKREQVAHANEAVTVAKNAAGGNASSKHLIIFVPIHPSSIDSDAPSQVDDAHKGGGLGLRGRLAAAALRRSQPQEKLSTDSIDDDDSVKDNVAPSPASSAQIVMLSKEHKEVHRKFINDFPNGRTCILSSLLDSNNNLAPDSPIQKQDFNQVLQEMGKTVLSGFIDRISHYGEELKRCENGTNDVLGTPGRRRKHSVDIDWKQYFLIKESAALTFQQMNLPREALREYEELEAKFPAGSIVEMDRNSNSGPIRAMATKGQTKLFRKFVRSIEAMGDAQYPLIGDYVFARQIHLLFSLKFPRAAVVRSLAYVKKIHKLYGEQANALSFEECKIALLRNEAWAAGACWDLKSAAEGFYSHLLGVDELNEADEKEKVFISRICDVLNFARMRLIKISEMAFSPVTSIRKALAEYPSDALHVWVPWDKAGEVSARCKSCPPSISADVIGHCSGWIKRGLISDHQYENIYIELCDQFVGINRILQRKRFASRILAEVAEIYITRGDLDTAVQNLLVCIDNCSLDPWDSLLSWRVFRLACCQRRLSNAPEYLKTLTYCLGTRLSKAVPMKLRHHLQKDLEAIVHAKGVSEFRWTLSPLFGMKVDIQKTTGGNSIQPLLQTNVRMHSCEIGDQVQADVVLKSNLTESIQVDSVKMLLLKVDDYQRLAESNDEVTESDAAFVLAMDNSISIEPGDNVFSFPWATMSVGQYVISSVCIQWHKAAFHQDFTTSSDEVIGFDVLPNEPTQSIELNPIFLIPGHVQDVRLHFYSGSDCVNGGMIKLVCSQGLQVMSPVNTAKEESLEWHDSCEFDLDSCLPNASVTTIVRVKSEAIDSYDPNATDQNEEDYSYSSLQSLEATVTTSYHHGAYKSHIENGKPIESPPITAILEASVTALELAALTIKSSGAYSIGDDHFMVSATVLCNTPVPFRLKEWEITLPSTLYLDEDGELNDGLFDSSVIEGEELFFGFRCKRSKNPMSKTQSNHSVLSIVLEDQFGKSFRQVLPLDIRGIDEQLKSTKGDVDNIAIANAELKAKSLEGLVGAPVMFTYNIDCSSLKVNAFPSQILYHLSCVDEDWIVGGSVRGTLNCGPETSCSLTFVGIPIKAGIIKSFPRIELASLQDLNTSATTPPGIKVVQKHPSTFMSLAYTSVDEMTCASTLLEI
jgi:hypothetical protein